jgi:surfactin synthase thioesterase subunit
MVMVIDVGKRLVRPCLTRELIDTLESKYSGAPVVALGHSLGGFLSYMVRLKQAKGTAVDLHFDESFVCRSS